MELPLNFIKKIALQRYIDSNRPALQNKAEDWRPDVASWFALTTKEQRVHYAATTIWLEDWAAKYPEAAQFALENWEDVDFTQS